ncbi:MAG: class I SAM-dependent methyltransferase [Clostridium sp.]|nr:class I SAM-dependent methyltransferase [Clostridium sp.]
MEAYTGFAGVYDIFMEDVPYNKWADFLAELIETYGISKPVRREGLIEAENPQEGLLASERNLVLDLGCGTGTLTELLYQKGYDMIGVDNSEEMLGAALEKRENSGSEILYLCQDMRELDLYSTVGTVVCICDSINYLLEDDEVEETFALVNNYLYPGGLFIFDFNTVYKYEQVIGDKVIAENREECSFIWENYYHEAERLNEYDLTIFVKEKEELFRRFTETHFQRGYTLEEMKGFVEKAGMEAALFLDADTRKAPTKKSERIYVVARECRKRPEQDFKNSEG